MQKPESYPSKGVNLNIILLSLYSTFAFFKINTNTALSKSIANQPSKNHFSNCKIKHHKKT